MKKLQIQWDSLTQAKDPAALLVAFYKVHGWVKGNPVTPKFWCLNPEDSKRLETLAKGLAVSSNDSDLFVFRHRCPQTRSHVPMGELWVHPAGLEPETPRIYLDSEGFNSLKDYAYMISQIAKLANVTYRFEPLKDAYGFHLETPERSQTFMVEQNWDWWDPKVVDHVLKFFQGGGSTHFYWEDDGQAGFLFYLEKTKAEQVMQLEEIHLEFIV